MQNGKSCISCGKKLADSAFYKSSSPYHKDGLLPMCRKCCITSSFDDDKQDIDIDRFQQVLRQCDKPYRAELYQSSIDQIKKQYPHKTGMERVKTLIGFYMKNLNSLQQYQNLTFDDNNFSTDSDRGHCKEIVYVDDPVKMFGEIYTTEQLAFLKAMYNCLEHNYDITDQQQRELLIQYVKDRLMQEYTIAANDICTFCDCDKYINDSLIALKKLIGTKQDIEFANYLEWRNDVITDKEE